MLQKVIRRSELEVRIGLSRSTIYARLDPKSPHYDPTFPRPIDLGGGHAVGWLSYEVDEWLEKQAQRRTDEQEVCA
jgi:prophage regulatory protein